MVLAYHVIFGAYGFWLPNDPRGSWSKFVASNPRNIKQIVAHLKGRATQQLHADKLWPVERPVWSKGCWKVFLNKNKIVWDSIGYVEKNPEKEGKPRQTWTFVEPYTGSIS